MNRIRFIYTIFGIAIAGVIALGCSVGKKYNRPDVDIPEAYVKAPASRDSSLALQSWEDFFQDTTLSRLVNKALSENFDLQIAIKRVDIYQSLAKQARAAWLPSLQLQATASTLNPSQNSLNGISLGSFLGTNHIEDYALSGNLAWELDVWGKIRSRKKAALAEYLQTYEATKAIQISVIRQVADAYYNLLMMDAQLEIARRNIILNDSIVQIMQLQKDAGEVTSLAVEQAIAQRQTSALLEQQLEQAITLQENGLRLLLGDWPGGISRSRRLEDIPVDSVYATGVPADLLRNRPDLRSGEQALIAANARVGVAQANLYPSLSITASGGINAFKASEWFTVPASLFGLVAGNLTQPLFQRRTLKTQLEIAKAEREQSVIAFRQAVTTGVHDVTNALVKLETLKSQQNIATQRVSTLQNAVRNAQLLFRSGLADYLEVITAQRSALDAELEQAIISRQQLSARTELYQALGGGWYK